MTMFIIGMLVMWFLLSGLITLNDLFPLNGGVELFDGWLSIIVSLPWIIIAFSILIIKRKMLKFYKKNIKKH